MNQLAALLIRLDALDERLDARRKKEAEGQLGLFSQKGEPCGNSWIPRDKTCHKDVVPMVEPAFKAKIRELEAAANPILQKYKAKLDGYYESVSRLEVMHTKATDELLSAEGPSKRIKAKKRLINATDLARENEYKLIAVMENIMNDMNKTSLSERDLMIIPQTINFADWGAASGEPKGHVKDFARMFNGRGLGTHNGIQGVYQVSPQTEGNRAYNKYGYVVTTRGVNAIMFHELMHSVEHQRPWMAEFARNWAASKAIDESSDKMPANLKGYNVGIVNNKPMYQLGAITGDSSYRTEEVAWVDDYVNPYMGKYYPKPPNIPASTEVWTIAAEHFTHPMMMAKFFKKHPDLFRIMVGLSQTSD